MGELQNLDADLGLAIEAYNGTNVELDRIEGELDVNARIRSSRATVSTSRRDA